MSVEVVVRRIRPDEADPLREIRLRALADAPGAFTSTVATERRLPPEEWCSRARLGAEGVDRVNLLAELDGRLVGMVTCLRSGDGGEVVGMWTAPEVRRRGVGRGLLGAVLSWARQVGLRELRLWVVVGNDSAASLYRSMGFVPTDEVAPVPDDPCRDEQRMILVLGSA